MNGKTVLVDNNYTLGTDPPPFYIGQTLTVLVPNFGFQDSDTQIGIAPVNTQAGALAFNDTNRIVKNNVRINIGSSPNSNTGDPLRTAFIKIGNFMEAVYRADSDKDLRIKRFETPVGDSDFRILGVKSSNDLIE